MRPSTFTNFMDIDEDLKMHYNFYILFVQPHFVCFFNENQNSSGNREWNKISTSTTKNIVVCALSKL